MNKKVILIFISLLLVCSIYLVFSCTKKINPTSPSTFVPSYLQVNFTVLNSGINLTYGPLVFKVFRSIDDMMNIPPSPILSGRVTVTNGNVSFTNVPSGTYYLLIFWDNGSTNMVQHTQDYTIYNGSSWQPGVPVQATPVYINEGHTTTVNINVDFNSPSFIHTAISNRNGCMHLYNWYGWYDNC